MPDYKEMYFHLAASIADAVDILLKAQQDGESDYLQGKEKISEVREKKGID